MAGCPEAIYTGVDTISSGASPTASENSYLPTDATATAIDA